MIRKNIAYLNLSYKLKYLAYRKDKLGFEWTFVDNRIGSFTKKIYIIYNRYGIKGLFDSAVKKIIFVGLPTIYRSEFLSKMHHPRLQIAFLELTNKCNLHCKMCKWQSRESTGYINRSLFESCVDQLADIRLEVLNLQFGGESLLHPDFESFLKYAIKKRDEGKIGSVGLTDNGMLFNQEISDLFVSLKVDWINFSLDGLGKVNDNIRLGSKYAVIEKNIKNLLQKRGISKSPTVLLNMVDYGKTEEQKLQFFEEWVSLVDSIELIPSILPNNKWANKDNLSPKIKIAPSPAFCSSPFNTIIIAWNGKVTGCCFDSNIDMVLGDLQKEPIKKIWRGEKFRNLRRSVVKNDFPKNSPCIGCEFWKVNFEPGYDFILNGKARIEYSGTIRKIRKNS